MNATHKSIKDFLLCELNQYETCGGGFMYVYLPPFILGSNRHIYDGCDGVRIFVEIELDDEDTKLLFEFFLDMEPTDLFNPVRRTISGSGQVMHVHNLVVDSRLVKNEIAELLISAPFPVELITMPRSEASGIEADEFARQPSNSFIYKAMKKKLRL